MAPVIARPDDQVWNMIRHDFNKIWEKGYATMKKIVVIGGGTMGLDIAQVFAKKGYDVVVRDINDQIIQASEARLNKSLDKLVAKGKLDEAGKAAITGKMTFTTDLNLAADADLVVWDPAWRGVISAAAQTQNVDYTPFEGFAVSGRAETVLVNGEIAVKDGRLTDNSLGEYVPRTPCQRYRRV